MWDEIYEGQIKEWTFNFSGALYRLKQGIIVTRKGWNWKNQYIALQERTEKSKMTQDYLYIKTAQNQLVPWLASQGDLLAEDWLVYENKETKTEEDSHILENIFKEIRSDLNNKTLTSKIIEESKYTISEEQKEKVLKDIIFGWIDIAKKWSDKTWIIKIEFIK